MINLISAADWTSQLIVAVIAILALCFFWFLLIVKCYKKCPSDKVMVIYGKLKSENGKQITSKCVHGGAYFIWPIIQAYTFLDLTPITINIELNDAETKDAENVSIVSRYTVGISIEPGVMQNAAERLLGVSTNDIGMLAEDIIFGQMRLAIASKSYQEIKSNRDKFLDELCRNIEIQLRLIGLRLINVNIRELKAI